jgi:hypothetical protein
MALYRFGHLVRPLVRSAQNMLILLSHNISS